MKNYESYIHSSGQVMVLPVPDWATEGQVEEKDPHVVKYFGMKRFPSKKQAG